MRLTQEEQRELAIKCGAKEVDEHGWCENEVALSPDSLSAYTDAVEARERERVSLIVQNILDTSPIDHMRLPNGEDITVYSVIESQFRRLINE